MIRLEDLNLLNLKIFQDDELYCFTSDAVLLSRFATVKKGDVVADFCSGSGIVGLHLYGLNPDLINSVTLFELQKPMYDLSVKSIEYNCLQDKFTAVNTDLNELDKKYYGKFSLVVCNPPYTKPKDGAFAENPSIAVCKTEIKLDLKNLVNSISHALKYGGRTCLVYRADRIAELIYTLKEHGLEPKIIQPVSAKDKDPYLVLVQAVKGGNPGVKLLKTIIN
ncbi:MAG: methyltransferase [Clostridia bacterium]|nr:methyltransferase [Clostridia bacterium]